MFKKLNVLLLIAMSGMSAFIMTACTNNNVETTLATPSAPAQAQENGQTITALPKEEEKDEPKLRFSSVNYRYVALTNFDMDHQGNQIKVKPGKTIQATLNYAYDCSNCQQALNSQIIIGLAKRSAQACIYNGSSRGQGTASFAIRVPAKPGRYYVHFRGLQTVDCDQALKVGWSADNSPISDTTIGTVIVSRKAEV